MAKEYDATLNALIDDHVDDWATFLAARLGVPAGPATPLDTDLSSTLQADRLFRIDGPRPFGLHLELESTGRLGIPAELMRYNKEARRTTGLRVHSVLVLLRPKANPSDVTGYHEELGVLDDVVMTFRYTVVRLWEELEDSLATAGLGFFPLTLLTNEAYVDLPAAVARYADRLRQLDLPETIEKRLIESTAVLCGLRYDSEQLVRLYEENAMIRWEDSTIVQHFMERGKQVGLQRGRAVAHSAILVAGEVKFGPPPDAVTAAVRAVNDMDELERLVDRIGYSTGWDDLLATP